MAAPVTQHLVSGTVKDRLGNIIVGATVTLTHESIKPVLFETTGSDGKYVIGLGSLDSQWAVGQNITLFSITQFKGRFSSTVKITSGASQTVNLTMEETSDFKIAATDDLKQHNLFFSTLTTYDQEKVTHANPLPVELSNVDSDNPLPIVESGNKISILNSSTTTLAGDAVFTGGGDDVSNYASVSILYKSDVAAAASGLSIQFSQDNINWDVQLVGDLGAKTFQVHRLVPAAQFFRIVYTNGSVAQSFFRLQCIFHTSSSPILITRAGQPQSTVDATPTRQTAEIDLDFARKHIPGGRSFFFFGHNKAVGTSYVDIWPGNTDMNWQTTAAKIKVQSSDTNDTSAGTGCRSIEVHGLSATGADQDEVIAMNGTDAVESSLTYIRVNKVHNETVGTYGGSHEGDIEIRVTNAVFANGALLSKMVGEEGSAGDDSQYGLGEASNGFWTVPLGKVLYITNITVNIQSGTNKSADVILYEREGILNTSAPQDPRRILWNRFDIEGAHTEIFKSHIKIKELTDLWFRAEAEGASTRIDVKCHFYLVDADASGA